MRSLAVAFAVLAALALPSAAAAHATLLHTTPSDGAVLATPPQAVAMTFDDAVHVADGNAVVSNATRSSVLAAVVAHARVLTLRLRPNLPRGAYSVRWSIVSNDGHKEEGVLAFAVGAGSSPPQPVLGAAVPLTWSATLLRTLYYLGLLAAAGVAVFSLATRRVLGDGALRPLAHALFFSLLVTFVGGGGLLQSAPEGTRFALALKIALVVCFAGAAAAALAPRVPRLLLLADAASVALLAAPPLAGHALDPDQPRALAAVADLAHIASAAVWLGGLLALVSVLPRATADEAARRAAVARFSPAALGAVVVLAGTGAARVLTELSSASQLWSTSYGRTLVVKTVLFAAALAAARLTRSHLTASFARLRRPVRAELVALTAVVVAVATLTELRPGVETAEAVATAPLVVPQPPVLPPRDAVVDARELGSVAVAVAREPRRTTVTLIGPDATGLDGQAVRVDGVAATTCGPGCYRAASPPGGQLDVAVGARMLAFDLPAAAPDAQALLARVTRVYRAAHTVVFEETLASTPSNATTTRFTEVAPDRLSYHTTGGPSAVVIGDRRWDRTGDRARWVESPQTPLRVASPYWSAPTNAHLVAPGTITFLDRRIPAWFRLTLRGLRPTVDHMTAASHFMTDRYVGFDVPAEVSPPASR